VNIMQPNGSTEAFSGLLAVATIMVGVAGVLSPAAAETLLARGTYLMKSIVACGNFHTPKGPSGELPGM
jgi:hypothetical protein